MDDPLPDNLAEQWELFFQNKPPSQLASHDDIFNHPVLFPLQRRREMDEMLALARTINPQTIFEIGADKAGSLYHWCDCIPSVKTVIACEIRGTPYAESFRRNFPHINFVFLDGLSSYHANTVADVQQQLDGTPIDILFLDGDKSHFDTDFFAYQHLLNNPSIALFHDINDRAPTEAYNRVVQHTGRPHKAIINTTESAHAIGREALFLKPASAHEAWLRHWKGKSCGVGAIFLGEQTP